MLSSLAASRDTGMSHLGQASQCGTKIPVGFCREHSLKTHYEENCVFGRFKMFVWHFSDNKEHVLGKLGSKLHF